LGLFCTIGVGISVLAELYHRHRRWSLDYQKELAIQEVQRKSDERFRALLTATSDAVYSTSPDWSEVRQLVGKPFLADTKTATDGWLQTYIHPDDRSQMLSVINQAIQRKSKFELEHRVNCADSSLGWTFSRAIPLLDGNGEISEWFVATSDITERKRMENALSESESRFRLFMDNSPAIAWIKDEQGRYVYLSKTFERLVGVRFEEWRGKTDAEFWPEETAKRLRENDMAVLELGRPMEVVEVTNADGNESIWLNTKFPILSTSGERFVGGIGVDITNRKKAEEALRRSEKLAAAGRLAATIAHEVNNPLAGAMNAVYIGIVDPAQASQMLKIADQELRRAAHITQQTLGFYRERGAYQQGMLPKLIEEILTVYATKLRNRHITVQRRYSCGSGSHRKRVSRGVRTMREISSC